MDERDSGVHPYCTMNWDNLSQEVKKQLKIKHIGKT